jgi:hypothetical protein
LIVSDVAAVDTVLLRFLVIAPGFKLNGSFRFSGHCTAHTQTFPRLLQLIPNAVKLFCIPVVHLSTFSAAGGILLRDLLGQIILVSESQGITGLTDGERYSVLIFLS